MNTLVASMLGLGPHEMSGGAWAVAAVMLVAWAVLAIATVCIAMRKMR